MATKSILKALLFCGLIATGMAQAEMSPLTTLNPTLIPLDSAQPTMEARQLRGKVVYVDFWASWCVPCRASFPWLEEMHQKYRDQGLVILGINKDQTPADAGKFLARHPASFPLMRDPGDTLVKGFAVKGMPSAYLVDRKGEIRHVHVGFRQDTTAEIERLLQELLKESPP